MPEFVRPEGAEHDLKVSALRLALIEGERSGNAGSLDFGEIRRKACEQVERARALIRGGARDLDRGDVIKAKEFFAEWDEELDD